MPPLQSFVDSSLPTIKAAWLNAIDAFYFTLFNSATTAAQARAALGSSATGDAVFVGNAAAGRTALDVPSNAEAILDSIIDAAGDLIVGTAADTPGRLAKGTALQILQVNAGATALEWGGPIVKRKTADESVVTSTALQDDDHLTFTIAANEEWVVKYSLDVAGAVNQHGIKTAITVPAGATLNARILAVGSGGGNAQSSRTAASGGALTLGASNFPNGGEAEAHMTVWVLNGANAGSVTLQWAQATSNAIAMTLRKGSFAVAHRIA